MSGATTSKHHRAVKNSPDEVKKSREILENVEGVGVGDNEKLIEHAQQEVLSISSDLSSIAVLDDDEAMHPSDSLHFNIILSKGIANW